MIISAKIALVIIGIASALSACGQNNKRKIYKMPKIWQYISNPNPKDKECRTEVARAKRDFQKGKLVLCSEFGMLGPSLRYESELRDLCAKYSLEFNYEVFSDVILEGQTQGCYGAFMDQAIAARFGPEFKETLISRADSIFIVKSQTSTVAYTDCDTRPSLPNKPDSDLEIYIKVSPKLIAQPRPKVDDYGPFMDVQFIIEKSGEGHNFEIVSYLDSSKDSDAIRPFEATLWSIAQTELQKIPVWVPGMVQRHKVKTKAVVRVHFEANT